MNTNTNKPSNTKDYFLKSSSDIEAWLFKYELLQFCSIVPDSEYGLVVNCSRNVGLNSQGLKVIPVKFNLVKGEFSVFDNELTNLHFAPRHVEGGFCVAYNLIQSLQGSPLKIEGDFDCYNNKLKTLEHGPDQVEANYNCASNELCTLEFLPNYVKKKFFCNINPLIKEFHGITNLDKLRQAVFISREKEAISQGVKAHFDTDKKPSNQLKPGALNYNKI